MENNEKKYQIISEEANSYQISQLSFMLEDIDLDMTQQVCHKDSKLRAVYNQSVKAMIENMISDDMFGVFLVYDTFAKVIDCHEKEESFYTCYNYYEILTMIHRDYAFELSLFIEEAIEE